MRGGGGGEAVTAVAVGEVSAGGALEAGCIDSSWPGEMREDRLKDLPRFGERATEGGRWWAATGEAVEEKKTSCW